MQQLLPVARTDLDDIALGDLYAWPEGRLTLRANMVMSLDGMISGPDGLSGSISGPEDKRVFALMRRRCDAVIVGAETAMSENYGPVAVAPADQQQRMNEGLAPVPPVVVVSSRGRVPPDARVFGGPSGSAIAAVAEDAPPERIERLRRVTDVIVAGTAEVDPVDLIAALHSRGMTRLLLEGGPTLLASCVPLLDELCLTISPLLVGSPNPPRPAPDLLGGRAIGERHLQLAHLLEANGSLLARWLVQPDPAAK